MQAQRLTVEELCVKLKPIFGKRIDDIYLKYTLAGRDEKENLIQYLNALYHKNLTELLNNKVLLEPPLERVIDGEYPLGVVSYADRKLFPFKLREKDWPRHVCISGMSGSGKTTFAFNILCNFIEKNKPFLVFDWKKSFRPLIKVSPDVMCFTIGNKSVSNLFKMNINQPPKGIDPKEWVNVLCDLLVESFAASFGVHKVLLETLDESFKEWGVYEGSENYPTWEHIKYNLEEKSNKSKGRESGWYESALRIASVLTFGNFGEICNYKGEGNLSVEDLLDKKVILELNALSNIEKKFFCEFVLAYIYKLKKARQEKLEGKFDFAILVDEAHNIFLKMPTHFVAESVTDMIYREMREYGISLICLDQHISKLSDTVKGNSACHVAFQQQLNSDIMEISSLMQLQGSRNFFSMLPVGSAIVKLSERYTSPFLIEVSPFELRKESITEEDLKNRTSNLTMSMSLQKGDDPEFVKEITSEKNIIKKVEKFIEEKPVAVKKVKVKAKKLKKLNSVQQVLYDFVKVKLDSGRDITELENLLESGRERGGYSISDIGAVINHALAEKFGENHVFEGEQKIYKVEIPLNSSNINSEQEMFLSFLQKNSDGNYGTVDIYKQLGLSARKGNKIKNELLDQNKIRVEEIRNDKGWKKIIRLSAPLF
ncbi:MAG: DUF87 domain-containing protein [archaeon]